MSKQTDVAQSLLKTLSDTVDNDSFTNRFNKDPEWRKYMGISKIEVQVIVKIYTSDTIVVRESTQSFSNLEINHD